MGSTICRQQYCLDMSYACVKIGENKTGTGFFIGKDGTILTCFHVIGDPRTGRLDANEIPVTFKGKSYLAEVIRKSPLPQELDFAVLKLRIGKLPDQAFLPPLGSLNLSDTTENFKAFGFRQPNAFDGLHASGVILGPVREVSGVDSHRSFIQLSTSAFTDIDKGMSGAPVLQESIKTVVGMIVGYFQIPSTSCRVPLAIPLDVLEAYTPLQERILEEKILLLFEKILSPGRYFTQYAFKDFYKQLPIPDLIPLDELERNVKPENFHLELISQIRGHGHLYDLIQFVDSNYHYIPLDEVRDNLPRTHRVDFVNRKKEQDDSVGLDAPVYMLFDGPIGYGKTELLKTIQQRHYRDRWYCLTAAVKPDSANAIAIARQLAKSAGLFKNIEHLQDLDKIAFGLSASVNGELRRRNAEGILILVSELEWLDATEIDNFMRVFLRAFNGLPLRVRLAGRYIAPTWKRYKGDFELVVVPLSPFKFEFVHQTVKKLLIAGETQLCAALLMHTTGGHPGIMMEILQYIQNAENIEALFRRRSPEHKELILRIARQVRDGIPEKLRGIFDVLSIFRRYNQILIDAMIDEGYLEYNGSMERLVPDLLNTHLINRSEDKQFLRDDVTRRLLAIRLRIEEPRRYTELCRRACEIVKKCFQDTEDRPDKYALDYLYQKLLYDFQKSKKNLLARKVLYKFFFAAGGTVDETMKILTQKKQWKVHRDSLAETIFPNNGGQDTEWDFQFEVNFMLRNEDYSTEPCRQLREAISNYEET